MQDKTQLQTLVQYHLIEALSSAEVRYRNLLDTLSEVVFSLDENGYFTLINRAWQIHTGLEIADYLGQGLQKIMPEAEYQRWEQLQAKGDFQADFQIYNCLGQLQWFDVTLRHMDSGSYGTMVFIDERKKSALALIFSEQQFRTVVESVAEILFQVDQDFKLLFLNPAWESTTGFAVSDSLGRSLLEFIDQQDHEKARHVLSTNAQQELRLSCANGTPRWMSMNVQMFVDTQNLQVITGAILDIHERRLMEESLRLSEERYALLASSTSDGIWDWDLNTDQVYYSPRWKEMIGYQDGELENAFSTWHGRVHPSDIQAAMNDVMDCLEGNKPVYENIHRMRHREGHWVWILDRGIVLRNNKGLPYRMIGSHADVTQLKNTEQALLRRERELDAIVNISPDGIVTISHLGTIQSVNPAFEEMIGLDAINLLGLSESKFENFLLEISSTQSLNARTYDTNYLTYCIDLQKLIGHELYNMDRSKAQFSGQTLPKFRVLSRTERNLQSDDIAKVLYFRDISIETDIDQMKSAFLSTAAHELRTPMASVFGFSELLLSRDFDPDTQREIVQTIHQQSQSLVSMLNQLLDLARIESRIGIDFCFLPQPVWPVVQRAISELLIPGDTRVVNFQNPRDDYWVEVDADKLRQVISNVLANAYKYSPNGGKISVSLQRKPTISGEQAEIGIAIQDQGLGMSNEQLKHIFERFWRANHGLDIPGTGLGMSLVKEIMDIHQGRVDIKSKPNSGTTVTLWLKQVAIPSNSPEDKK